LGTYSKYYTDSNCTHIKIFISIINRKKMKKNILAIGAILGATVGLSTISLPTFAATLVDGGSDELSFKTISAISKIGEVEGIAGGGSKEIFFGINGSSTSGVQSSVDLIWEDNKTYNWNLTWNPNTNQALFNISDSSGLLKSLNYTFSLTTLDRFNAFGLLTKANAPDSQLAAGTTMKLNIGNVSFTDGTSVALNDSVSSTSGGQIFDKQFYVLSNKALGKGTEITSMSGTFSMDWLTVNPQRKNANSRISFEVQMFNASPVIEPETEVTVPEPNLIFGLLGLGALGVTATGKRKKI
jgi:hypothetical protein